MQEKAKVRYHLLDQLRGFAVVCMIVFHAMFTFSFVFGNLLSFKMVVFFMPAEPFFAFLFIFLSGLCCTLSKNNLKRGFLLLFVAIGFTITTLGLGLIGIECEIWFGILHLISASILFFCLIEKLVLKTNFILGLAVCLVLFFLTINIAFGEIGFGAFLTKLPLDLYDTNYMFWLGFCNKNFVSYDYFPLLPWLFAFLFGVFAGKGFKEKGFPKFFEWNKLKWLSFIGRHSLLIYILHQPIIFFVGWLFFGV